MNVFKKILLIVAILTFVVVFDSYAMKQELESSQGQSQDFLQLIQVIKNDELLKAEQLIKRGADINQIEGNTPLMIAMDKRNIGAVDLLLGIEDINLNKCNSLTGDTASIIKNYFLRLLWKFIWMCIFLVLLVL